MEPTSKAPVPKVWASSAGAGLGGAGGAVVVWALQSAGVDVPPEIGIAISTFISIIASFAAGYLTPPKGG
jgi:tetrahydromethanopterin S-methyltransferase subunit D